MYINIKNIVICIILIILISLSFDIILNIRKNEYIKKVIKSDSQEMLKDYIVYNDMDVILNQYIESIRNSEYRKLNNMSLFYAKKTNNEYEALNNKLNISDEYTIAIDKVYVLERNIYKCIFNITRNDGTINEYTICIKVNSDEKYFRVLDFII